VKKGYFWIMKVCGEHPLATPREEEVGTCFRFETKEERCRLEGREGRTSKKGGNQLFAKRVF